MIHDMTTSSEDNITHHTHYIDISNPIHLILVMIRQPVAYTVPEDMLETSQHPLTPVLVAENVPF